MRISTWALAEPLDPDFRPVPTPEVEAVRRAVTASGATLQLFNGLWRARGLETGLPLTPAVAATVDRVLARERGDPDAGGAWDRDALAGLLEHGLLTRDSEADEEALLWRDLEEGCPEVPPVSLLEVTTLCRMTCDFCGHTTMSRPKRHMSLEDYALALERVAETGQTSVTLYGYGEPLLHPHIVALVRMAADRGLAVALSTVPVHLDEALSAALLDAGLRLVNFSIDSLQPEVYRQLRGRHAKLDVATANVEAFLRLNRERGSPARTQLRMVSVAENAGEERDFVAQWRARGVDVVYARPYVFGMGVNHERRAKGEEGGLAWASRILCTWPWRSLVLWMDGHVSPCCLDAHAALGMGDWRTTSLAEIWRSEAYEALRAELREGGLPEGHLCGDCEHGFPALKRRLALPRHSVADIEVVAWEF